jgi:DNA-directed RNA polymerase subunit RPC12/RpoP
MSWMRNEPGPVSRECGSCGYKRWVELPAVTRRHMFPTFTGGFLLWPFYLVLAPVFLIFYVVFIAMHARRMRRWQSDFADRLYSRCPACGSDRLVTVDEKGFVPSAGHVFRQAPAMVACPSCGVKNRLPKGHGTNVRCGKCKIEMRLHGVGERP